MAKKPPFTAEYISKGADTRLKPEARELAEQLFFMRAKLKELRKELKDAPLITEYDNGGQQRGTHLNPAYKAHRDLLLTYTKTLSALEALIGKNDPNEAEGALAALRNNFKVTPMNPQGGRNKATGTDNEANYWKTGKK